MAEIKQSPYLPKQMNGSLVNGVMQTLDGRLSAAESIIDYLYLTLMRMLDFPFNKYFVEGLFCFHAFSCFLAFCFGFMVFSCFVAVLFWFYGFLFCCSL